ncbi:adenine nucleotide alpha hydrolases-like protein [Poronia punctata]|nr:adenine nucleotide alpha hydrolases-like protein [Poronia punctata]
MAQNNGDRSAFAPPTRQANSALNGYTTKSDSDPSSSHTLWDVCLELRNKVDGFLAEDSETSLLRNVQARVREAMEVIDEAFQRYDPQEISISYNGGKDCLVMLILILAGLARRKPPTSQKSSSITPNSSADTTSFPDTFQAVYIVSPHPFTEIDDFVISSSAEYQLDVTRYELGMKEGLETYLGDRPNVKAIFVGTRRTDPHGEKLTHFDRTDSGWPDFMRVHPVIDWHYVEIWAFIRHLQIPYCSLYDQGYTSLGGTKDTHPNPNLKKQGENGVQFLPAYELVGDSEERLGRDR